MTRLRLRRKRAALVGAAALLLAALPVAAARSDRGRARVAPPPLIVRVQYGESLWTLAKSYGDRHRDVRAVIAAIAARNGMESAPGSLRPGQEVAIPADCLAR